MSNRWNEGVEEEVVKSEGRDVDVDQPRIIAA